MLRAIALDLARSKGTVELGGFMPWSSFGRNITLAMCLAGAAAASPRVDGNLVVVDDTTGTPHDPAANPASVDLSLCAFASRGLYSVLGDDYDVVVSFTTHPMTGLQYALHGTTPSGYPVRQEDRGVAFGSFLIRQAPSVYGSAAKLKHCVYMGPLRQWPADPDMPWLVPAGPFGGTMSSGLTGIEVLGHEFGHHWLMWAGHDQNDGRGMQALFRADPRDPDAMDRPPVSSATLHYSALTDSHSVMYGSWITPLPGGQFKLEGGDRKYGPMDQYFMGLRAPGETPPLLTLDDGSQRGLVDTPLSKGQSKTVSATRVDISVDDIVRAIGPRSPAYPNTQRCFRAAFVLITHPGYVASAADLALVETYRKRWETWYPWATDGRGLTDTRLSPADPCPGRPSDVVVFTETATPNEPLSLPVSVVVPPPVDEEIPERIDEPGTTRLKDDCGCGAGGGAMALLGLAALLAQSHPRRRVRS